MEDLRKKILLAVSFLAGIFLIGTLGYRIISSGEATWVDCAYMTIITLASVGYGEVVDLSASPGGRVFTIFLIVGGISGFLYFLTNITAYLVEGEISKLFWRGKMKKAIDRYKDHYIVCGCGETGAPIVREFMESSRPVVVIETNLQRLENLKGLAKESPLWVEGDATSDEILIEAGVKRAKGLVACAGEDKDNLLITMSARHLNEKLRIVTRCKDGKMEEKLRRTGADSVVSPNFIGGMRMASELVRPTAVSFLDIMLRDKQKNLRVEDVNIPDNSRLVGKTLREADFRGIAGLFPIAVQKPCGEWVYSPFPDLEIERGMKLIIIGNPEQRLQIEKMAVET